MKQRWVVRLTMLALAMLMIAGDHTTAQMAFAPNNGYMRRMLRMRLPINNTELMQNASATGFNPATHHTGYLVITTRVGLVPTRRPGSRPAIYGKKTNYFFTTQYRTVTPGAGKLSGSAPTNVTINIGTTNTNNLYATYNFPVQIPVTSRGSNVFSGGSNIYVGPLRQTPYSPFQSFVSRISSSGGGGTGPGGGGGVGPPGPRMPAPAPER